VMVWLASLLLKLAVTLLAAVIISVQVVAVPVHAPLQPVKVLPVAGVAVNVIATPLARLAAQAPEVTPAVLAQSMPSVLLGGCRNRCRHSRNRRPRRRPDRAQRKTQTRNN
jgi:hypothetical protein